MPKFQTFNILIFLATLTKVTRTQSSKLGSSSLYRSKISDPFPKSASLSDVGGPTFLKELQSALDNYPDALDEKSQLAFPEYPSLRKPYRPKPRHGEIMTNEIEELSGDLSPYSRYLLLKNVIPNIPPRTRHHKDPIARYFDKMREVKAIEEALRLKKKKERARLAFAKAVNRIKTHRNMESDGDLEEIRRPMKFRRAKVLTNGQKFQAGRVIPNFKPSTSLLDRQLPHDFRPAPHISFPVSQFGNRQPMPPSRTIMFPPQTGTQNSGNFGPKAGPPTMGDDVFFVNPSSKFTPPLQPSHSLSSLAPSSSSDFFDLPVKGNPRVLSQPVGSGSRFYEMPTSGHHSNVPQPLRSGSVAFQEGFHSFSVPFDGVSKETQQTQNEEAFPSSDTWGADGFVSDDSDCADIKSKSCQSDLDCNCFGFYTCMAGKCHSKQMTDTRDTASQPRVDGWHDQPVDFGFVKRGHGLDQYRLHKGQFRNTRSTRWTSLFLEPKHGTS